MRIMAFDYGTKRIGIAVTDPLQIIATALTTIHPNEVIQFIKQYMNKESVEKFIVGMPLRMDGSDSQSMPHVKGFVRSLKKNFPQVPVVTMDERFTSKMASSTIAQSGMRRAKRQEKSLVDKISAVIILQSYMESSYLH
ncbi:Holliday junction resolvase RuvX [Albibacterium profundi]|uniref:Putative pre-16S rRNA nuclease n=1 Tax=Albibacterium profundi TaxID=3134906 RepID=A0ABV5CD14_9SPHI